MPSMSVPPSGIFYQSFSYGTKKTQMYFHQLDPMSQIGHTRNEFVSLIRCVFETPEVMKRWLLEKQITEDQAKRVLSAINKHHHYGRCYCCKRFDVGSLNLTPIDDDLQPLLHIAQLAVKSKLY